MFVSIYTWGHEDSHFPYFFTVCKWRLLIGTLMATSISGSSKSSRLRKAVSRLCPTSAPSDAGRRPSVLGMPRAARGCARASYLQPWRPRRPPSRTTTSSDKLCAEGDTRLLAVARTPLAVAIATKQPIAYRTHGPSGLLHTWYTHDSSLFRKRSPVTQGGLSHCAHGQGRWKRHSTR